MIDGLTSLLTHVFEDRAMKMSTVTLGPGCSLGPRSVVLYDAGLAEGRLRQEERCRTIFQNMSP
jgi:hypothetical protein